MEIIIDQRIELLGVIQTICGYWDNFLQKYMGKLSYQCNYRNEVKKYFEIYKKHETIKLYNKLCNENSDISHYYQFVLILSHSELPELNVITNYNNNFYNNLSQNNNWINFIKNMKQFYKDTNFKLFFENNKNEYKKLLYDFGNKDEILKNTQCIFDFLSIKDNSNYKTIISSLVMGCYGINIKINELKALNYTIMCPEDYKNSKYVFDYGEPMQHILWHEISHTVINNLTKIYIDEFNIENMKIPEKIIDIGYSEIQTFINEYIIRSIVYLLTELFEGDNSAVLQYKNEENFGFTEIDKIKDFMVKNCVENNKLIKEKYKKLIHYVIEIIKKSYCA